MTEAIEEIAKKAVFLHWPIVFADVMSEGGFDCVVGNPPWERVKLQEQEFFATRDPEIAEAPNAAARGRLIQELKVAEPGTPERALYDEFETAKRLAEASSAFVRASEEGGGRFPLTGRGDVNTYALFAELFANLPGKRGRAGVIVPTGVATDATTAPFFSSLIEGRRLATVIDFENRERIFPAIDSRIKFSLLTIGRDIELANFAFFLTDPAQLNQPERRFTLSSAEIARLNPNTKTAPVFRSRADAELTAKIYSRVPVLVDESRQSGGNAWQVRLRTMFHKSNASDAGVLKPATELVDRSANTKEWLPVHEGDYGHQFDHRFGTFDGRCVRTVIEREHSDPTFEPEFESRARTDAYSQILDRWGARPDQPSLLGFRRVARSTDDRTLIAAIIPTMPLTYGWIVAVGLDSTNQAILCANFNSLVCDYCLRNSLSQPSIPQGVVQQIPVLPPAVYTPADLAFVTARVLELTYTSHALAPFARDLGYDGPPFGWDEDRRALLRAELDAFYARAYGLSRDQLRYILDPADVRGPDYPSETFRVLKDKEVARYNEYRTQRLVLEAWDGPDERRGAA